MTTPRTIDQAVAAAELAASSQAAAELVVRNAAAIGQISTMPGPSKASER